MSSISVPKRFDHSVMVNPHRSDPAAYLMGELSDMPAPPGVHPEPMGAKFAPDGSVLRWPGNTVICHIDPKSAQHRVLCEIQAALKAGPHAACFTYLPPASLHMTVFQGVSNGRNWPSDMPEDASLETVTNTLDARLEDIHVPPRFEVKAHGIFAGFSVTMSGANAAEESALRQTRSKLRDATGIIVPDFENYIFHITLGYLLRWLDPAEAQSVAETSAAIYDQHADALGTLTLGPLEFCRFENMHHFEPLKRL